MKVVLHFVSCEVSQTGFEMKGMLDEASSSGRLAKFTSTGYHQASAGCVKCSA